MNNVLQLNRHNRIKIVAPLIEMSKKDIVKAGVLIYNIDFSKTWTCYAGNSLSDATTASSSLRLKGFIEAGYKDPLQYKQQEKLEELYKQNNCKEITYAN